MGGAGGSGTGKTAGAGGFNGGAQGAAFVDQNNAEYNYAGGGGGGASDIRKFGLSLSDRIVVVVRVEHPDTTETVGHGWGTYRR